VSVSTSIFIGYLGHLPTVLFTPQFYSSWVANKKGSLKLFSVNSSLNNHCKKNTNASLAAREATQNLELVEELLLHQSNK